MGTFDVVVVSVAVGSEARARVVGEMLALGRDGSSGTPAGRAEGLGRAIALLRAVDGAWAYGAVRGISRVTPEEAQRWFQTQAADLRARYRTELVRNADGTRTDRPEPDLPDPPDDPGF